MIMLLILRFKGIDVFDVSKSLFFYIKSWIYEKIVIEKNKLIISDKIEAATAIEPEEQVAEPRAIHQDYSDTVSPPLTASPTRKAKDFLMKWPIPFHVHYFHFACTRVLLIRKFAKPEKKPLISHYARSCKNVPQSNRKKYQIRN